MCAARSGNAERQYRSKFYYLRLSIHVNQRYYREDDFTAAHCGLLRPIRGMIYPGVARTTYVCTINEALHLL